MAKQEAEKEETRKIIPYYPELRELIPSLGFKSSTEVFSYLRKCKVNFGYDRIACSTEDEIKKNIEVFNLVEDELKLELEELDRGFIFVMDIPDTIDVRQMPINIDVIHCFMITKDDLIKYLKLKVFS